MGIKSKVTHADNGGNPHTHTITLWVAFDTGGGPPGQTNVNVSITWDTEELGNPTGVQPAGAFVSAGAGLALWQNVTVNENGADFTVTLQCQAHGSGGGNVEAVPEEVGSTARPKRYSVLASC